MCIGYAFILRLSCISKGWMLVCRFDSGFPTTLCLWILECGTSHRCDDSVMWLCGTWHPALCLQHQTIK